MKTNYVSVLLTGLAVIGVGATAVLVAKATPKAMKALEEKDISTSEIFEKKVEVAKTVAPIYAPAAAVGVATIGCIIGANSLNLKQQAALAGAYGVLATQAKKYKDQVKKIFGPDADDKVVKECLKDSAKNLYVKEGTLTFYDSYSDEYFERTMLEVVDAEYQINRKFRDEGHVTLNDFYECLGLPRTNIGENIGWSIDAGLMYYGYEWIDFVHPLTIIDDDLECYTIEFVSNPTADYLQYDS